MYNEEQLVHDYCAHVKSAMNAIHDSYDYEILLVNDGSADRTLQRMSEAREADPEHIAIVNLSRNFGLEGAVWAGLLRAEGDAVVVMDADLQDPPTVIIQLIEAWEGGADIVHAVRAERRHDSFFKRLSASVFYRVLKSMSGKLAVQPETANFKLLSRNALTELLKLPECNPTFRSVVPFVGFKTAAIEYGRDKRFSGSTKYGLRNMIPYALNSLTCVSVAPLRMIFWLIPISALATIFFLLLFLISSQDVWRTAFLMAVFISAFSTLFSFALSLIAEYTAQIMTEVKARPISIVSEFIPTDRNN
jgi:dolichol-phosphate mannosyltransferase